MRDLVILTPNRGNTTKRSSSSHGKSKWEFWGVSLNPLGAGIRVTFPLQPHLDDLQLCLAASPTRDVLGVLVNNTLVLNVGIWPSRALVQIYHRAAIFLYVQCSCCAHPVDLPIACKQGLISHY